MRGTIRLLILFTGLSLGMVKSSSAADSSMARADDPSPAAAAPAPAPRGRNCLDEARTKLLLEQTLALQMNPFGLENQLQLSLCFPLIREPGLLFDFTNFEVGLTNYVSPSYVIQGGFVSLAPLSILTLRAELAGTYIWKLPMDGAGYVPFSSYDDDFSEKERTQDRAQSAGGYLFSGSATLRARIGQEGHLALAMTDTLLTEYWSVGDGPYYANLRQDALLKSSDWLVKNTGALLLEIPTTDAVMTRVGVFDDLTVVPNSGRTTNTTGVVASLRIAGVGAVLRNLYPFLKAGVYTHHGSSNGFRTGELHLFAGCAASYELAAFGH